MTIRLGTADLAKYPFLNEAAEYMHQTFFNLDDLNLPELGHIVERASNRIRSEIEHGKNEIASKKDDIQVLS